MTTDIIVGFPGETEEDYQLTRAMTDRIGFDNAFVFRYSPRKDTPAATMAGSGARGPVKEARNKDLLDVVNAHARARHDALVGQQTVEILCEGPSKNNPHCASAAGRPRTRSSSSRAVPRHVGQIFDVRVVHSSGFTLYGECDAHGASDAPDATPAVSRTRLTGTAVAPSILPVFVMDYSFKLKTVGLLVGLLLVALHALALGPPGGNTTLAGGVSALASGMWAWRSWRLIWCGRCVLVYVMDWGEFYYLRTPMLIALPIFFYLTVRFVDEFLAVRALGIFLLLAAAPLLDAAFLQPPVSRLLVVVLAYWWIISGMAWISQPHLMRDQIGWMSRSASRWTLAAGGGIAYGVLLLLWRAGVVLTGRRSGVHIAATNSSSTRTPNPVAPRARSARSLVIADGPAMSRCAHGVSSANVRRNAAAVHAPPGRPLLFLMSAMSLLICSLYSG